MQFIDFNEKAIKCISLQEWRDLGLSEVRHTSCVTGTEPDVRREHTIVCLSYDTGVRYERFDIAPHMAGKTKEIVHEDLISCRYAVIWYEFACKRWFLTLNFEDDHTFPDFITFKTREDAINAARLCKNAKTRVEACEILAKEFPTKASKLLKYADLLKAEQGLKV